MIDEHRGMFGVELICGLLPICPVNLIRERRQAPGRGPPVDARSQPYRPRRSRYAGVFNETLQVCGIRKACRQLQREGFDAARCTAARLIRVSGAAGHHLRQGRSMPARPGQSTLLCASAQHVAAFVFHILRRGRASSTWLSSLMLSLVISSAGGTSRTAYAGFVLDALDQYCMIASPINRRGLVHHSTVACNMGPFAIANGW